MNEEELNKFKKYLGSAIPIELEAPDGSKETFYLKPLRFEDIGDLILLGKAFASFKPDSDPEEFFQKIDEETVERLKNIVDKTLKISYPDLPDDIRKEFAARNFFALIGKIFEINSLGAPKTELVKRRIESIRRAKK